MFGAVRLCLTPGSPRTPGGGKGPPEQGTPRARDPRASFPKPGPRRHALSLTPTRELAETEGCRIHCSSPGVGPRRRLWTLFLPRPAMQVMSAGCRGPFPEGHLQILRAASDSYFGKWVSIRNRSERLVFQKRRRKTQPGTRGSASSSATAPPSSGSSCSSGRPCSRLGALPSPVPEFFLSSERRHESKPVNNDTTTCSTCSL